MTRVLVQFERLLGRTELVVVTIAMAVMLFAVSSNVISRAFPALLPNMNDLAMMAMAMAAFAGAAYSTYSLNHICIEFIPAALDSKAGYFTTVVKLTSVLIFSCIMTLLSWSFFSSTYLFAEKSSEMQLPLSIPIGTFFFASVAMVFHTLMEIGRFLNCLPRRQPQLPATEGIPS